MKPYLGFAIFVLFISGCASVQHSVPAPIVLENKGTEFPTMCILLQSDGSVVFRGGFAFYSPSFWRRTDNDVLTITLGGKEPFPAAIFKEQLPKHAGGLLSVDEKRREISYRFNAKTEFLNFGNFYFYRVDTCHAS